MSLLLQFSLEVISPLREGNWMEPPREYDTMWEGGT